MTPPDDGSIHSESETVVHAGLDCRHPRGPDGGLPDRARHVGFSIIVFTQCEHHSTASQHDRVSLARGDSDDVRRDKGHGRFPVVGAVPPAATEPSLRSTRLWVPPAEIATTCSSPAGTLACPNELAPQATTVPSLRRQGCDYPRGDGHHVCEAGGHCALSEVVLPPTTVPSSCRARLWNLPADTAVTLVRAGGTPSP